MAPFSPPISGATLTRREQVAAEDRFYASHSGFSGLAEYAPFLGRVALVLALFAIGFASKMA